MIPDFRTKSQRGWYSRFQSDLRLLLFVLITWTWHEELEDTERTVQIHTMCHVQDISAFNSLSILNSDPLFWSIMTLLDFQKEDYLQQGTPFNSPKKSLPHSYPFELGQPYDHVHDDEANNNTRWFGWWPDTTRKKRQIRYISLSLGKKGLSSFRSSKSSTGKKI